MEYGPDRPRVSAFADNGAVQLDGSGTRGEWTGQSLQPGPAPRQEGARPL